jgi:hypothetical protein
MAELTPLVSSCCSPARQAVCCEPEEKDDCCTPASSDCGCSAILSSVPARRSAAAEESAAIAKD